jgi:hypothetical protein
MDSYTAQVAWTMIQEIHAESLQEVIVDQRLNRTATHAIFQTSYLMKFGPNVSLSAPKI